MRMSDWSSDVCSSDLNYGENNGTEGATDDPRIEAMRLRQIKNLLATLLLSRGVPMLLGGDEFRRPQRGHNHAYCTDNATPWCACSLAARTAQLGNLVQRLIAFVTSTIIHTPPPL